MKTGRAFQILGTPVTVLYAGAQGSYPALDQVDVLVPASLAGTGVVNMC